MGRPEESNQNPDNKTVNIWKKLLNESSTRSKTPTINLVLVGNRGCGKSSLLSALQLNTANPQHLVLDSMPVKREHEDILGYSCIDIVDPNVDKNSRSNTLDIIARLGVWRLSDINQANLLQYPFTKPTENHDEKKNQEPIQPIVPSVMVIIALDLSQPWTIKETLEQWIHVIQEQSHEAPVILVGCKSDDSTFYQSNEAMIPDYIQYYLRTSGLKYGAPVMYTSAKTGTNCAPLRQYLLFKTCPELFPSSGAAAELVNQEAIYVPYGYDSMELIQETLLASTTSKWNSDLSFEAIVPEPRMDTRIKHSSLDEYVQVEEEQVWLENLEKGGALTSAAKASARTTSDAKTKETRQSKSPEKRNPSNPQSTDAPKDPASSHLTNFFQNLLSRSEKDTRHSSSDDSKQLRQRAKEELRHIT